MSDCIVAASLLVCVVAGRAADGRAHRSSVVPGLIHTGDNSCGELHRCKYAETNAQVNSRTRTGGGPTYSHLVANDEAGADEAPCRSRGSSCRVARCTSGRARGRRRQSRPADDPEGHHDGSDPAAPADPDRLAAGRRRGVVGLLAGAGLGHDVTPVGACVSVPLRIVADSAVFDAEPGLRVDRVRQDEPTMRSAVPERRQGGR